MSQLGYKAHALRTFSVRPQRRIALAVRAQATTSNTSVRFKIHRHVEYGQALLVLGSVAELGSWDPKQAVELTWGEGDNWTASLALPQGSSVEYKYITRRRDSLEWCPGQNKAFALPSAAAVEVTDTWDNPHNNLVILTPAAPPAAAEAPAEAPVPEPAAADVPAPSTTAVVAEPVSDGSAVSAAEVVPTESDQYTAVSTVENIHVAELEAAAPVPAAAPAAAAASRDGPSGSGGLLAANNIVQGVPEGAVAVGVEQDPVTQYEEADKFQVVEVGPPGKVATVAAAAVASSPGGGAARGARPAGRSVDSMTVAELKSELKRRGMSSLGTRRELITRLQKSGALD